MKRLLLPFFLPILASSAKEHPRILTGMALSAEQMEAYGVASSTWPSLATADRLMLEHGDRRVLLELKNFKRNDVVETMTLSWTLLVPGSVTTGSKKFEHGITARQVGEGLATAPAPPRETLDSWSFSWRVDAAAKRVVFELPVGVYYTLIQAG